MISKQTISAAKKLSVALAVTASIFGCKKSNDTASSSSDATSVLSTKLQSTLSASSVPSGSYDLTKSLPSGYVKDGSVDYTTYVQAAITNNSNVTFPAFPILVNDKGIIVTSNKTLTFLSGAKILMKPTSNGNYNVFRLDHASNVTINNPVIVGDATTHLGSSGEWGCGIAILSSSNITVTGGSITYCWGDGIYLATSNGTTTNTNINITGTDLEYNRRDGISITSVIGLTLESITAKYSNGTSPMCGINFEPGSSTDELQNINVNNAVTSNNGGSGIQIGYSNLYGGSNKTTSITILNHADKKSLNGVKASDDISKRKGSEHITGTLNIIAPFWRQETFATITTDLYEPNLKLTISKPIITDVNGVSLTQAQMLANLIYKTHINAGANYSITF